MKKQVKPIQSLGLNNQQIQIYEPKAKRIEDIFPKF